MWKFFGTIILLIIVALVCAFLFWFFVDVVGGNHVDFLDALKWSFVVVLLVEYFGFHVSAYLLTFVYGIGTLGWKLGKRSAGWDVET